MPSPPADPAPSRRPAARRATRGQIAPEDFGFDEARHLLWRAGFGGTPEQIHTLAGWGPERSVDYLLNVESVPFDTVAADRFRQDIMRPPTAAERRAYRAAARAQDEESLARFRVMRQQAERADRLQIREVQEWWLTRMVETPRPLEEKMTLFWHGHFATSYRTVENSYHMFRQNQLFRENALGSYAKLMYEIIRDPAMLAFLDNNDSRKDRPNENLARELMELFSLGVGNYTEHDIKEGARALTGYTFEDNGFVFRSQDHDNGQKSLLGRTGSLNGDGFVSAILEQRATARFIARKLYRSFVADLPADKRDIPPDATSLIDAVAGTLRARKYEVRPALRQILLSEHFYSREVMGQQVKSPVQLVVGAARSLNAPLRDLGAMLDALDLMGQSIFFPPSVKGWDGGRAWINTSTLYVRQNVLAYMLTGRKPQGKESGASGVRFDPEPLLGQLTLLDPSAAADEESFLRALAHFVVGRESEDLLTPLRAFAARSKAQGRSLTSNETLTALLMLLTAAPEYQLC